MIDLSDVVNDPDFAQDYVVTRRTGIFATGKFKVTGSTDIPFYGIIQPASEEDLAMVPEGDRVTGMMGFISQQQMYKTNGEALQGGGTLGLGDQITWQGQVYKIIATTPWVDFGFWKAIGARQSGT
jgi:hypothetical protein